MKLGFICLNVPGHLNPMSALARRLQERKHDVVFPYSPGASGLPFVSGEQEDPVRENISEVSKLEGEGALDISLRNVMNRTETILKSLPEMVKATGVDALVLDTVQFYAELGPIQLGMPYIHVANALHFDYSGYTPLCFYGWPHQTTPAALARNREGVAKWAQMLAAAGTGIRAWAARARLQIDWEDLSSTISPWASITQTPRVFEFESSHCPPQFHHTGPFINDQTREKVDFPWERLTGEPLIYASMGTLMNGRPEVFRTIAAAVGKHKGLQLVLSIGNQLDPKQIGPVPSNAIVVRQAPQLDLLKQTSVCITHAGLNTVLESLAEGVPQLAIPVTYDQPGVAARIADKKTGVVTSLDKLTVLHLSDLLGEVLSDSTYRGNAVRLQKAIAQTNGPSVAADLIEQSLGIYQAGQPGVNARS
jgi:zeaxanthin glucosyltransferase